MRSIDEILDDIKKYKNIPNDYDLANLLGVKANTVSTWRSRKTIPYKKLVAFANVEDIDINDVLNIEFSQWRVKKGERPAAAEGVTGEPVIKYEGPERRRNWPYSQEEQEFVNMLISILRGKNEDNKKAIIENIKAFYKTRDIEIPGEFKKVKEAR